MIAADTNIVLRLFIQDDIAQSSAAQRLFSEKTVWISHTVILECEWVLRSNGYSRSEIEQFFDTLIHLEDVVVEDYEVLLRAINAYQRGMDFADALHITVAQSHEIDFISFDKKLVKKAKALNLVAKLL